MRILLISFYFPPFNSVGAIRPAKLASYLLRQGHHVRILTCANQPFPPGFDEDIDPRRVTAAPAWSINAPAEWLAGGRSKVSREGFGHVTGRSAPMSILAKSYRTFLHWPDNQIGWVGAARRAGSTLMAREKFDLIYATAPPFSAFRVAASLSRSSGIPWIAELRDLWTDNHSYGYPNWRYRIEKRWETHLLGQAAALVTVSEPLARKLRHLGKPVWEIRNGFDPFDSVAPTSLATPASDAFQLVYTGNIYPGFQDTDIVCKGIAQFAAAGGKLRLIGVGRDLDALRRSARNHGINDIVEIRPTVPRPESIGLQKAADGLLLLLWKDSEDGVYTTKFFEYTSTGKPILAIGSKASDLAKWILTARLGEVASDAYEVVQILNRWSDDKAAGRSRVSSDNLSALSRDVQFKHLESLLNDLISRNGA